MLNHGANECYKIQLPNMNMQSKVFTTPLPPSVLDTKQERTQMKEHVVQREYVLKEWVEMRGGGWKAVLVVE